MACALVWLLVVPRAGPPPPPDPAETAPHLLIQDVEISTTGPSGRVVRRLRADEVRRAGPDADTRLVRPRLTVFPGNGASWRFTAERGELPPGRRSVRLPGPVHGHRGGTRPLRIDSRDVRIVLPDGYAESDDPSTIRGTGFESRGTGMRIWLEEGRIELLSETRGSFVSG